MKFSLAVAKGEKKLLKSTQITQTEIYRLKEFSFKKILEMIGVNGQVRAYILEDWFASKRGSHNFLGIVLASLKYEFVKQIYSHAIAQRQLKQGVAAEVAPLQVCDEMAKLLAHHKFIPGKKNS